MYGVGVREAKIRDVRLSKVTDKKLGLEAWSSEMSIVKTEHLEGRAPLNNDFI